MTNNIRNIVNLTITVDDTNYTKKALIEFAKKTKTEPGCISFEFYQYKQNEKKIILLESFQDNKAMQEHLNTEHTQTFFTKNTVSVDSIETINALI